MAKVTAVFDACVLYPAPLRDLLMSVALTHQFQAKWSEKIHEEWTRNLLKNRQDLSISQLQRTVELMNNAIPDSVVEHYEGHINSIVLPDPDDRHIVAVAIKSSANVIVTNNLKDFPEAVLASYRIEVQTPDIFLCHIFDVNQTTFCTAIKQLKERLKKPPKTSEEILVIFHNQGLTRLVCKLRDVIDLI